MTGPFYVYEHILDNNVFYVGHGCGNRAYVFKRNEEYNSFVGDRQNEIIVNIVKIFDTKREAYYYEVEHSIKRRKEGNLVIGKIGQRGKKMSEEVKHRISETLKGNQNARGYTHSNEARIKMSIAKKGKVPWNKGIPHSEETKRKISETKRKHNNDKKI